MKLTDAQGREFEIDTVEELVTLFLVEPGIGLGLELPGYNYMIIKGTINQ